MLTAPVETRPEFEFPREQRVLIAAPTGHDAEVLSDLLSEGGMTGQICQTLDDLCREFEEGAAAAIIADEILTQANSTRLLQALNRQPDWSDFPIIVMAKPGDSTGLGWRLLGGQARSSHAILLARPIRKVMLLSTVRNVVQSRFRQYQIRDELLHRQQAEDALRENDRRKDEFLATLAHELRNPLAPLANSVELLRMNRPDQLLFSEIRDIMERQIRQLSRLVDDLLDMSRITRGKVVLRKETVRLSHILTSAVETSMPLLQARHQKLVVDSRDGGVMIHADPVRLTQVIANLLNNASKFTDVAGQIVLSAAVSGQSATITVRDTGIGIPPDKLSDVFRIFSQVDHSLVRSQGGLGIGLTLAKSFVEMHGGQIEARSKGLGFGSEFVITLPLGDRQLDPGAPEEPIREQPRCRRVLVVDDTRAAAILLARLLEALGQEVETYNDAESALIAAETREFEMIFSDIAMPQMDGYELARRLRASPRHRTTTLVALTGYGQDGDRELSQEAGFNHHLVKPVNIATLRELLRV